MFKNPIFIYQNNFFHKLISVAVQVAPSITNYHKNVLFHCSEHGKLVCVNRKLIKMATASRMSKTYLQKFSQSLKLSVKNKLLNFFYIGVYTTV